MDALDFTPYQHLPIAMLALRDGRVCEANPAALELLGLTASELIGQGPEAAMALTLPESERAELGPRFRARQEGRPTTPAFWVRLREGPDGASRDVRITRVEGVGEETLYVVEEGPGERATRHLLDALRHAASALTGARTDLEVLDGAVEALYQQGFFSTAYLLRDGHLFHGPMRQDAAGLAMGERLYGRPVCEVAFPLERAPRIQEAFRTGRASFTSDIFAEVDLLHDPEVAHGLRQMLPAQPAVIAPLFSRGAPFGALVAIGPGLSPGAVGAIELFALLVEGALEGVRRLAELGRLQAELVAKERLAAIGEAAAVVSHEVRNPLGAISNGLAVLRRDPALRGVSESVVTIIEEEVGRLELLVRELLEFARPLEPQIASPVELRGLAAKAVEAAGGHEESGGRQLSLTAGPEILARADPRLIRLALDNLLRNALQATASGGRIQVRVEREGERARVLVDDSGPGVSSEDAERIFAPFFTTRAQGTGLGLALVDRIARSHGGRISVHGGTLGGARFVLELPAS